MYNQNYYGAVRKSFQIKSPYFVISKLGYQQRLSGAILYHCKELMIRRLNDSHDVITSSTKILVIPNLDIWIS